MKKPHQLSLVFIGEEAVLLYSVKSDGSLDFHHTEVPSSQRGKGLGGLLAQVRIT